MKRTLLITTLLIFILTACSSLSIEAEEQTAPLQATDTADPGTSKPLPVEATPTVVDPAAKEEVNLDQELTATATPEPESVVTFGITPGESSVTYEVGEVFINRGNVFNLAVGVTNMVSGEIQIDYNNPQNSTIGPIQVDISEFTSDSGRRDRAIRENWLESAAFPIATFVSTEVEGLPENGEEGVEYPLQITGDLTVREVTREVIFDAVVKMENNLLSGTAKTTILLSDFGVGPIDILGILKTEDEAMLSLDFSARANTDQQ